MNSKLEAISHLSHALRHNKKFKKAWTDYIELQIIEAFEELAPDLISDKAQLKIAKESAKGVLRLFDPIWWEAQGLK